MSNLSPDEQALQDRISESVVYAHELEFLDGMMASELLADQPSIEDLRDRTDELSAIALATNCTGYVDAAMRRARGAVEDAAGLGLVPAGDAREDAPTFWGLDSDASVRLVAAAMLRAGSIVLGRA
jgi:hypothetical protein